MAQRSEVLAAIYAAVQELNEQFPEHPITLAEDSPLFGRNGALDSLGLVNLIVAVEQQVETQLGRTVTLADERALSQKHSPFATIAVLADYVGVLLNENSHD